MKISHIMFAAIVMVSGPAIAAPIADFTGLELSASLAVIENGATSQGAFTASLVGASTATIGADSEFTFFIGANNSSGTVNVDVMADGMIEARSTNQGGNTAVGSTKVAPFSFSLSFTFTDPSVSVLNYTSAGDLVRGDASVSGFDPIVWTFVSEQDNSFGNLMTFNGDTGPFPSIQITEADMTVVPLPAALPFMLSSLGLLGLAGYRGKRR